MAMSWAKRLGAQAVVLVVPAYGDRVRAGPVGSKLRRGFHLVIRATSVRAQRALRSGGFANGSDAGEFSVAQLALAPGGSKMGFKHQGCAYQHGTAGGNQCAKISHWPSIWDPAIDTFRPVMTTRPIQPGLSHWTM